MNVRASHSPRYAPKAANGVPSRTLNGIPQLSYCAASTRKTRKTASANTTATPGARRSWYDMSAQSKLMSGGSTSFAVASSASSACADEKPAAGTPVSSAERNRLKRLVNSGPDGGPRGDQRVERDHAARLVPHEEEPELLRVLPELRLGLHVHLVDAAELVEVVDVGAAEQRAERGVDVVQLHAGLQHLAAIDVGVDLRHARAVERGDASDLRPLPRRLHEALRLLGQVLAAGRRCDPAAAS